MVNKFGHKSKPLVGFLMFLLYIVKKIKSINNLNAQKIKCNFFDGRRRLLIWPLSLSVSGFGRGAENILRACSSAKQQKSGCFLYARLLNGRG